MAKRGSDAVWQGIRRKLLAETNAHVRVGLLASGKGGAQVPGTSFNIVSLGAVHEFGSDKVGIPARSFIGRTFEEKRDLFAKLTGELAGKIITDKSMTVGRALNILGTAGASEVKKTITSGPHIPPKLKPATVERKGSDRPLIDTGRMVNAIQHEVVNNRT